ncbi:MAG: peptidylprolyl isomerase [Armatimonadota bacterium]
MILLPVLAALHVALHSVSIQSPIPSLRKAPGAETVLAKVNGIEIKAKDIEDLLWEVRGEDILNDVMFYQVAKMEADKMGIVVTNVEVEQEVARQKDLIKTGLPPGQTLEDAMAQAGQTDSRLYLAAKASLYFTKLAMLDFDPKAFVRVSTIVVHPRSENASDIAATIQVVQRAYDRLKAGEPWEKLVDELVVDQEGKQRRGLLGWRELSAFPEEAKSQVIKLGKGGVTQPVQTKNGIQIFRIEAKGDGATKAELEQMRVELTELLKFQETQKIKKNLKIEKLYPSKKAGG